MIYKFTGIGEPLTQKKMLSSVYFSVDCQGHRGGHLHLSQPGKGKEFQPSVLKIYEPRLITALHSHSIGYNSVTRPPYVRVSWKSNPVVCTQKGNRKSLTKSNSKEAVEKDSFSLFLKVGQMQSLEFPRHHPDWIRILPLWPKIIILNNFLMIFLDTVKFENDSQVFFLPFSLPCFPSRVI